MVVADHAERVIAFQTFRFEVRAARSEATSPVSYTHLDVYKRQELNCGVWEGMLFSEVEQQFPEAFELRGDDPSFYTPPEAETHEACQERVFTAIEEIVRSTKEDVVVVAHAMVNLLFLAKVLDLSLIHI